VAIECAADVPAAIDLTAMDNCDGDITVSPTEVMTTSGCANNFTIVRTWTFEDMCGNVSSISQTITVNDDTAPAVPIAPSDVTVQCGADIPAATNLTATDNCDGLIRVSPAEEIVPGDCPNSFVLVRTWTFADICGNTSSVSQTISVEDMTAPVLVGIPEDVTVECAADVPSDDINVMAIDNCERVVNLVYQQNNRDIGLDTQRIVNTWIATDCTGNTTRDSQIVTFIVKQPSLELIKSSQLNPVVPMAGDTVFYDFAITNTGNTTLFEIALNDPLLDFIDCDIASIRQDEIANCNGFTILTQDDINSGTVCNSAEVLAMTSDGILTIDTSDSGNIADELGTGADKTFTPINQVASLELIKTISTTVDNNGNGVLDIGDDILYHFEIINTGNVTLFDLEIDDPIVNVQGSLPILQPGHRDTTSFSASYLIMENDAINGFVINSAIVNASTPASLNGFIASDVSDSGNSSAENNDDISDQDGDPTNDPVVICVVSPLIAPENFEISACLGETAISDALNNWITQFSGGGCNTIGVFAETPVLPYICGGVIEVLFQVVDDQGQVIPGMTVSQTFEVIPDNNGPEFSDTLEDIFIDFDSNSSCSELEAFEDIAEMEASTLVDVSDMCTEDEDLVINYTDSIVPAACNDLLGFMDERQIIRTYTLTDQCGNESTIDQNINLSFDGCSELTDFGTIAFGDQDLIQVPIGCELPEIGEVTPVSGNCRYTEYMWLVSTEELSPGVPIIPNILNIGIQWFIIDGENQPTYSPESVSENTYYVRCSRDISCCEFGESNIVAILINAASECPEIEVDMDDQVGNVDCLDELSLLSPTDDLLNGEVEEYYLRMSADADIMLQNNSQLTLDAAEGVIFNPNFEVSLGSTLEVFLDGCEN